MKCGIHTIRSGWTSSVNPSTARIYNLDNGDFESNMKITDFEVFPIGGDVNNRDHVGSEAVYVTIGTSEAGVIPSASTASPQEYGDVLNLRPSDSRQIAWGILSPAYGYVYTLVDPDHIIPGDLYVNAFSVSTGGSISQVAYNVGFMIRMENVKSTGSEALLYQVKESTLD
jgi:hypothetical protein